MQENQAPVNFQQKSYEFFNNLQERKDIINIGKNLTKFIHDQKISQLVLLDRAVRPVYIAVQEFWYAQYPDEKIPQIYFINPQGFKSNTDVKLTNIQDLKDNAILKGHQFEDPQNARPQETIDQDFASSYSQLQSHKNEPVLLFDTCIHSGNTITPIIRTMQTNGFTNIQVGVTHNHKASDIPLAFTALSYIPERSCHVFRNDRITDKTYQSVNPMPQQNDKLTQQSVRIRKQIREIVRDYIKNPSIYSAENTSYLTNRPGDIKIARQNLSIIARISKLFKK